MLRNALCVLVLILALCIPINLNAEETGKGLPPNELAKYSDSFEKLREDLWEQLHLVITEKQKANFLAGDISIENGKVRFETKTGGFSKAGFGSKFLLKGDFDIQIDCDVVFSNRKVNMDQRAIFTVNEAGKHIKEGDICVFHIAKQSGRSGNMMLGCQAYWRFKWEGEIKLFEFHGTLRFIRTGKTIEALYKDRGIEEWKKLGRCSITNKDMYIGFALQNFFFDRSSIQADIPISATFDNFKVNAAHGIVESDI